MAVFIENNTKCILCGQLIESADDAIAFPAFIPQGHEFSLYSDGVFHKACFVDWSGHEKFQAIFEEYNRIWNSRPKDLPFEEIEKWGKEAFSKIFQSGMIE